MYTYLPQPHRVPGRLAESRVQELPEPPNETHAVPCLELLVNRQDIGVSHSRTINAILALISPGEGRTKTPEISHRYQKMTILGPEQFHNFRTFGLSALLEGLERFKAKLNGFKQICTFGTLGYINMSPALPLPPKTRIPVFSHQSQDIKLGHGINELMLHQHYDAKAIAMKVFWSDQAVKARFWTVSEKSQHAPHLEKSRFAYFCGYLRTFAGNLRTLCGVVLSQIFQV